MTVGIAINGGGRIGLQIVRYLIRDLENGVKPLVNLVSINDPFSSAKMMEYMLKNDTVHGRFEYKVTHTDDSITIHGKKEYTIKITKERSPSDIPYKSLGVQLVLECTGVFTASDKAKMHMHDGSVKNVIISAPATGDDVFTCVLGVNDDKLDVAKHKIISNASCTTNCLAPLVKVLHETYGIKAATMTTTHATTATQKTVDGVGGKSLSAGRSCYNNIAPATTGAAKAIGKVIPELNGKIDGAALRVPTPNVSYVDFCANLLKPATVEGINAAFVKASESGSLKGILGIAEEQTVSFDYNGDTHSSIQCPEWTLVFDEGKMIKVGSFYDNESGFSKRMTELARTIATKL